MSQQMEIDEALRLVAEIARDRTDLKTQHAALRTVFQIQGLLTDKPMPASDRRTLASELDVLVAKLREGMVRPGAKIKIRAAFEAESTVPETSTEPATGLTERA